MCGEVCGGRCDGGVYVEGGVWMRCVEGGVCGGRYVWRDMCVKEV